MIHKLLLTLLFVALFAGIYFLGRNPRVIDPQTAPAKQEPQQAGYSARNARVVETGENGLPLYTLDAVLVRQHPNDDRVQLDAPRMKYIASDGTPWHISSRSGQIRGDGTSVELYGDVHVNGQLPGAEAPAVVDTSILSFDTTTEVASTHAPVMLDWNGRKLSGTGLIAKLTDQKLKLESRVHGSFPAK